MARKKVEEPSAFNNILNSQIDALINESEQEVDVITFAESPHYLNLPLHGVEKFILKVFYGLTLDDTVPYIQVRYFPHDEIGTKMTEVDYALYLKEQKRLNILDLNFKSAQHLLLVCGRRGGKTFIASLICCYEAYKLISKGCPQKHYGLSPGQKIKIITVATNGEQAKIASDMMKSAIMNSPWLSKFCISFKQTTIRLQTKYEYDNKLEPSIFIEAMPCTASGIRGHTVIVAILDELAHFTDSSGTRGGDSVYYSLTPSIATFGPDGKILALSNPYAKSGIFYTQYIKAMGNGIDPPLQHIRAFKIPTWEMNETLAFQFFKNEYELNPESFDYEYGAEFSGTITGFFKFPEKIDDCINYSLIEKARPKSNKTIHWLAMDPAAVGNGYALCMVHTEERKTELGTKKVVVVDRWRRWLASDEEFEELGLKLIDPAVIDEYIIELSQHFKIGKIRYDQFESAASVSKLVKRGLVAERKPITTTANMEVFKNLRNLIYNEEIELMDDPIGIMELKYLQEKKLNNGKFRVAAPLTGEVTTDDMADVLAIAAYMAIESDIVNNTTTMIGTSSGKSIVSSVGRKSVPAGMRKYQKQMQMQSMRTKVTMGYSRQGVR